MQELLIPLIFNQALSKCRKKEERFSFREHKEIASLPITRNDSMSESTQLNSGSGMSVPQKACALLLQTPNLLTVIHAS